LYHLNVNKGGSRFKETKAKKAAKGVIKGKKLTPLM